MAEAEVTKPEIEKFLLEKLEAGINGKVPYKGKFKIMKESLENQLESVINDKEGEVGEDNKKKNEKEKKKGRIREKLYLLNNLVNERNSKLDYLSCGFFFGLKRIEKDILQSQPADTKATPQTKSDDRKDAADGDGRNRGAARAAKRSTRIMATEDPQGIDVDQLALRNLLLYTSGSRRDVFNAVGIVGAEGVGKTTLAQSIFARPIPKEEKKQDEGEKTEEGNEPKEGEKKEEGNQPKEGEKTEEGKQPKDGENPKEVEEPDEVYEKFLPRIWISLAEDPAEKEESLEIAIVKRILLALGVSDETIKRIQSAAENQGSTLAELIYAVRLELMWKRYFVVLDDASEMKDWYKDLSLDLMPGSKLEEKLAFAFPKGFGGTVLVIGWPENAVKHMVGKDEGAIHRMLPLEDPKLCWKICEEEAKGDQEEATFEDKIKVEEEVVKRSSGLPAAARLMGKISKESVKNKKNPNPAAVAQGHNQPVSAPAAAV